MLKRTLCQATFTWILTCDGPLLIADGRYKKPDPANEQEKGKFPDKLFISRNCPDDLNNKANLRSPPALRYYVPGTSLRGPFRAQAERIIRSLLDNMAPPLTACDPFQDKTEEASGNTQEAQEDQKKKPSLLSCSKRLEREKNQWPTVYAGACPACKLFGCTGTASRIQFTDADFVPYYASVYRDMIGIDRFTGSVFKGESGGANMRFHALEKTTFTTTVTVTNFELWQLGLLAYVFRDFQDGLVPIGFGKTKGFGQVKGAVTALTLTYPKGKAEGKTIPHLGSLVSEEERTCYRLHEAEPEDFSLTPVPSQGLSLYETFTATDREAFWAAVAPAFNNFIDAKNQEVQS